MEEWLSTAASNPYVILLGIIGGCFSILAIPLAIFSLVKQRREKLPRYEIVSNNLVQNLSSKVERVTVLFDDLKVPNLTVSKVFFWNAGKETILNEDIAQTDSLRIISTEVQILDVRIIHVKKDACNFGLKELNPNDYELTFEFMDFWDAVILQVIHTGLKDDDITFCGTIKGTRGIKRYKGTTSKRLLMACFTMFSTLAVLIYVSDFTGRRLFGALAAVIVCALQVLIMQHMLRDENWLIKRGFFNRKEDQF